MSVRQITCPCCGTHREPNVQVPCPLCGSRQYPLLGYMYQHEAKGVTVMIVIMVLLLLTAIVIGLGYVFYTRQQLVSDLLPALLLSTALL